MIYIVVRRTTDWADETIFRAQMPNEIRPGVELWNATFRMPYHIFRRELARIAGLNRERIDGASCVAREDVAPEALVAPVDDDDWFCPSLGSVLSASASSQHAGYYWPSRFLEVPISLPHRLGLLRRALFPGTRPRWLCTTNNYAVRMGPESVPLLDSHILATRWFLAHPDAVKPIDEPLSVMNRTLASVTQLRARPSRRTLLRKFRQYRELYSRPLPAELGWCEPYVAMMRDLLRETEPRVDGAPGGI